jgi:hypothetical protein
VQSLLEAHATPLSRVVVTPAGVGIVWIVQLLPFQCSASIWSTPPLGSVPAVWNVPTATHAVVDAQVTPVSRLETAPLGLGVDWMDQLVPFQTSASVPRVEALFSYEPTATQLVLDGQRIPDSSLDIAPLGLGVVCLVHDVPFERSARVTWTPELSV